MARSVHKDNPIKVAVTNAVGVKRLHNHLQLLARVPFQSMSWWWRRFLVLGLTRDLIVIVVFLLLVVFLFIVLVLFCLFIIVVIVILIFITSSQSLSFLAGFLFSHSLRLKQCLGLLTMTEFPLHSRSAKRQPNCWARLERKGLAASFTEGECRCFTRQLHELNMKCFCRVGAGLPVLKLLQGPLKSKHHVTTLCDVFSELPGLAPVFSPSLKVR
mmetsp:Transcript_19361/g.58446  ORF Transcript_19361/g.58446 Transcript_19361/m.58446 type:complete len:215 (-) Transcript_19361:751-1395(-)